ncbi:protein trichome birefringence-like [Forsythia ovata]|uniref:Protein trichome birefringence-like n=1 Tax=Forsythia ovata TaxID=205694 RepID=A0ABD1VJI4_9LAMI
MDSFKNLYKRIMQLCIDLTSPLSASRTRGFFTLIITLLLLVFFFSPSDDSSPVVSYTSLASRIHSDSDQVNELSSVASPQAHFGSENYISCTDSAAPALSPVGTSLQVSRIDANQGSCIGSAAVSPVGTSHQDSRNAGNAPLVSEIPRRSSDSRPNLKSNSRP